MSGDQAALALARVRQICSGIDGAEERVSHGSPAWFRGGRQFLHFWDNHHDDGRLCVWAAAPLGAQETLISADPRRYFRPPYVGGRGWVGVELGDDPDWAAVAGIVEQAAALVARSRPGRAAS